MASSSPSSSPDFHLHTSLRYDPALLRVHANPSFQHAGWNYLHSSPLYMLDLHRDRVLRAAVHFGWQPVVDLISGDQGLARLSDFVLTRLQEQQQSTPVKVRVAVTKTAVLSLSTSPTPPNLPLESLFPSSLPPPPLSSSSAASPAPLGNTNPYIVSLDASPTTRSAYTHFKTAHRPMYDEARQRAGIVGYAEPKEVLLVNSVDNSIMEGSVSTPYFFRNGKWVTPPVGPRYDPTDRGDSGGNDGTTRRWALESGLVSEEAVLAGSLVDGEECWLSNGSKGFLTGRIKLS